MPADPIPPFPVQGETPWNEKLEAILNHFQSDIEALFTAYESGGGIGYDFIVDNRGGGSNPAPVTGLLIADNTLDLYAPNSVEVKTSNTDAYNDGEFDHLYTKVSTLESTPDHVLFSTKLTDEYDFGDGPVSDAYYSNFSADAGTISASVTDLTNTGSFSATGNGASLTAGNNFTSSTVQVSPSNISIFGSGSLTAALFGTDIIDGDPDRPRSSSTLFNQNVILGDFPLGTSFQSQQTSDIGLPDQVLNISSFFVNPASINLRVLKQDATGTAYTNLDFTPSAIQFNVNFADGDESHSFTIDNSGVTFDGEPLVLKSAFDALEARVAALEGP